MAFLPNAIKLYLHNPWSAEHLIRLNNAVMRSEQGSLSEEFKYRLAFIASRDNECTYCTAHHAATLKRRFEYSEADLQRRAQPGSARRTTREAAAFEYVHQASLDPTGRHRRDAGPPGRALHPRRGHGDHPRDAASGRCTTRCTPPWACRSRTRSLTRPAGSTSPPTRGAETRRPLGSAARWPRVRYAGSAQRARRCRWLIA